MALNTIVISFFVVVLVSSLQLFVTGQPQVSGLYIFGDSLSDCGTNNLLPTLAKSIYRPYGIDFPMGPTGRFTNGRTIADVIGEQLGFQNFIPTVASTANDDILHGLNYASGASGIRDETGAHVGYHMSMKMQLAEHNRTLFRIAKLLGGEQAARQHLSQCIFLVDIGSNDYLNNYFLTQVYHTKIMFNPQQYGDVLTIEYANQMKTLHDYGARKFVFVGLGQIGCIPNYRKHLNGECNEEINQAIQIFNIRLKILADDYNKKYPDSRFIYIDLWEMSAPDQILAIGVTNSKTPCCTVGKTGMCVPLLQPCKNRDTHFYFDAYHPSEAINVYAGKSAYKALKPEHVHPYDISTLAQTQIA